MENKYENIINLEHPEPKTHPRMSLENRSAIFAPFAALEGYNDDVIEAGRITTKKQTLTDIEIYKLNQIITELKDKIKEKPLIEITYFIKDNKKEGGQYKKIKNNLHQIDEINMEIILKNKQKIKIEDIINIKERSE